MWGTTPHFSALVTSADLANGFIDIQWAADVGAGNNIYFAARIIDKAGNIGPASAYLPSLVVDISAPAAPHTIDLAAADDKGFRSDDNITNQRDNLTLTAVVEAGSTVMFFNDLNNDGLVGAGEVLGQAQVTGTIATLDNLSLGEGVYKIRAIQTDAAGNTSLASTVLDTVIDLTPPAISHISTTAANGSYNAGKVLTFQVHFNEPVYFGGTTPTLNLTLNNGKAVAFAATVNTAYSLITFSYTVAAGDTNVGALNVAALTLSGTLPTLQDAAGNAINLSQLPEGKNLADSAQLRIDTLAPVAPGVPDLLDELDTGNSFSDNVTNARRPVLRVSLDENDVEWLKCLYYHIFRIFL
jgi:hypothetical protein